MATRKPSRGGGGGRGLKGGIVTGISIILIIGFILAWAQANNIKGLDGALAYFREWSQQIQDCGIGNLEWTCGTPIPGYGENNNGASGGTEAPAESGSTAAPSEALVLLDSITAAPAQDVNYNRSDWKHWVDADGDKCDTREETLLLTGINVTTDPATCKILSGTWVEPYANKTFTDSSKMDIDHIVALSYAASNGGQNLSAEAKQAFANDPMGLSISDASENRSKGAKGPAAYLPPNTSFHCQYVAAFVAVVSKYDLTMPKADIDTSRRVLSSC